MKIEVLSSPLPATFLSLILCACSSSPQRMEDIATVADPVRPTATKTWTASSTIIPPSQTVTPSATLPPPPTEQTSLPSPTLEPPDDPEVEICSPLEDIPTESLAMIISNPYEASRQGKDDGHPGLDFAFYQWEGRPSIDGIMVQATFSGTVAAIIMDRPPLGYAVIVETTTENLPQDMKNRFDMSPGESIYTLYAHLKDPPMVLNGSTVRCGQPLGNVGNTGFSGAPHLHLEVRVGPNNTILEPMAYYDTRATPNEMENYRLWRLQGVFRPIDPLEVFDITHP